MASVTNVWVSPLDIALASLAQLSLVRSAAVSKSGNHSSNFAESCPLKIAMSCSSEFVRFVCFCVVHNVSVYWHITSLKGSQGAGGEVSCALSTTESSVAPVQCGPIPPQADFLWLLLITVSC